MNIEKNNINPWAFDQKKLLDELAIDIANKFWIDKEKAKLLIQKDTLSWIENLKAELNKGNEKQNNINDKELEKLFFALKWALELIEKSSKLEIKVLKEDIEKSINIEDFKNHIEDYLPPQLINKAKNPQVLHEHILWFALWTTNSIITTAEILYKIWKWILQSPYHLYMILSWKAKTDSFKNI